MIGSLLDRDKGFTLTSDSEGVALVLDSAAFRHAKRGSANNRALIQFATLRILEEQGLAEEIGNGYHIPSEAAVQLDREVREQLGLPEPWQGSLRINASGTTFERRFSFYISLHRPNGEDAGRFDLEGPLIRLSEAEYYLPTLPQWRALACASNHHQRVSSVQGASEVENLTAVHTIQDAARGGADIDLGPFRELHISHADRVGVAAFGTDDGGLELIPQFDGDSDPEMIRSRLGQIGAREEGSIRIGDRIVILDRDRMRAVREIVENRRIKPEDRETFLSNPGAFLDASLVDLDLGFSIRVRGATRFRLAYFGETEGSEIDWFAVSGDNCKVYFGPNGARKLIKNLTDLARFEELFKDAVHVNAKEFPWSGEIVFQFDDPAPVKDELEKLRLELEELQPGGPGSGPSGDEDEEPDTEETGLEAGPIVVDIEEHDEDGTIADQSPDSWLDVIDRGTIETSNLQLTPYSYQDQGIRWILGLARESLVRSSEESLLGSLLADDMGLGKTFMTLAAIEQYFLICDQTGETARPVLVVAPLSLLETWRDEVGKVFRASPFSDIVILQADADLPQFRRPGSSRETAQPGEAVELTGRESLAQIRYSLYVGEEYPTKRLDLPKRLVLTSYQTLRDYQFSLSRVDWSFAVFDEAQNIKNPNALQSRAAKALKAKYRLVVTGTPVENELRDFWCLFDTARPAVLGPYQEFRRTYVKPILEAPSESRPAVRLQVGQDLRHRVGGYMLRRLKEDHLEGLPSKTILVGVNTEVPGEIYSEALQAEMPLEQLERYDAVISGVRTALAAENAQGAALTGLHNLRAVSLHPDCLAGGMPCVTGKPREIEAEFRRSGKLAKLLEILEQVRARREKAIIFCINKRLQAFLQTGLSVLFQIPVHVVNGDTAAVAKKTTETTRKGLIADFERQDGFAVIVMSPIAAGVGLTVVGANNVVHLERHWNPAKESQATDRVYRIGQKRPVNIYVPVLHHPTFESFDVNLAKLLAKKAGLRDAIITPEPVTPDDLVQSGIFGNEPTPNGSRITVDRLDTMNWEYFEALVAALAKKEHSAMVYLTDNHDRGCDVVVLSATGPNRLIQCKHTGSKRIKGYSSVMEIVAAKPVYEDLTGSRFDILEVFTNAKSYDSDARSTAKASQVVLSDRKDLARLMSRHAVGDSDVLAILAAPRLSFKGAGT